MQSFIISLLVEEMDCHEKEKRGGSITLPYKKFRLTARLLDPFDGQGKTAVKGLPFF